MRASSWSERLNMFPALKDEDFRLVEGDVPPRPEDVAGCVHVSVVQGAAAVAYPRSHSQPLRSARTAACAALGTGLGAVPLVRFHEPCSPPHGSLIREHRAKRGPAGIEDGLCHLR